MIKWRKWIKSCVSTSNFIMINGRPKGKFFGERKSRGFFIKNHQMEITYLQYIDDNLIFCKNVEGNIEAWYFKKKKKH